MDKQAPAARPAHPGASLSRRTVLASAAGIAAAGATAAAASGAPTATPTSPAATTLAFAGQTTIESAAVAPTVVFLSDGPAIAVDASLGDDFRVTIAASRAMGNPANPVNGQQIIFQITQGAGAPSAIAWGSGYEFSAGLPEPTLSKTAGLTDLLGFVYNAAKGTWLLAAFVNGFS